MSIVTLFIKIIPIILISNFKIPEYLNKILELVPIAVLSSMVAQFLIIKNGEVHIAFSNEFLWASVPTLICAFVFKSLFFTILIGLISIILFRYFGVA